MVQFTDGWGDLDEDQQTGAAGPSPDGRTARGFVAACGWQVIEMQWWGSSQPAVTGAATGLQ